MSTLTGSAATYLELLETLDGFLCDQGHAWGLTYTGAGTGRLGGYIGTATSVVETITAVATTSTSFTVTGSVSGALGTATVGTPFTSAVVAFTITAGGTAFEAGDTFTLNTTPKWTRTRWGGCPEGAMRTASFANVGRLFDDTFLTTTTVATTTSFPATVTVQMLLATEVRAFSIWNSNTTSNAPRDFSLQWSEDGSSWTTAQSWSSQTWPATYTRRDFVLTSSAGAHLYWRLNITAANAATLGMSEVRLFADAELKWDVSSRFEFAWEAPGLDGTQEIHVAGYTDTDNGADRYNLVLRGFRYWPDAATSVRDVPNNSGDKALLLSKTPTAYWLVANGARVMIVARTSSVYEWAYAGFGLPYEAPSVHPYPYLIGAPYPGTGVRWDLSGDAAYRNPGDPGAPTSSVQGNAGLAAIFPDGNFYQGANRYGTSSTEGSADLVANLRAKVWPYALESIANPQPDHLRECIDGSSPLLPLVIYHPSAPVHVWGEFDGAYWTTGFGASAEALIRDGAIDCLVVPNINRSAINSFAAIALD